MKTLSQETIARGQELADQITQLRDVLDCQESDLWQYEREEMKLELESLTNKLVFVIHYNAG